MTRFGSAKIVLGLLGLSCASWTLGCRRGSDEGATGAEHGDPGKVAAQDGHAAEHPEPVSPAAEAHAEPVAEHPEDDSKADAQDHGDPDPTDGSGEGAAPAEGTPTPATGAATATGGTEATTGGPTEATAEGPSDAAPEKPPAGTASTKDLLKEVTRSKTTDPRALEALAQAEAGGATPREVAKAAYDRGKVLHTSPERAAAFFEWAAQKDPKYADPLFALAQQSVVTGDVDVTIERLKEVKARRGERLLQQIEFDPMWEIVRDDPAVRALF